MVLSSVSCKTLVPNKGLKKQVFEDNLIEKHDNLLFSKPKVFTKNHIETYIEYNYGNIIFIDKIMEDQYENKKMCSHVFHLRRADSSKIFEFFDQGNNVTKIENNIDHLYGKNLFAKINNQDEIIAFVAYRRDFGDTKKYNLRILKQNKRHVITRVFPIDSNFSRVSNLIVKWKKNCKQTILNSRLDTIFYMKINSVQLSYNYIYKSTFNLFNSKSKINVKSFKRKERDKVIAFLKYADTTILKN